MGSDALPKLPAFLPNPSYEPNILDPRVENRPGTIPKEMGPLLLATEQVLQQMNFLVVSWAKLSLKRCTGMHFWECKFALTRKGSNFQLQDDSCPGLIVRC